MVLGRQPRQAALVAAKLLANPRAVLAQVFLPQTFSSFLTTAGNLWYRSHQPYWFLAVPTSSEQDKGSAICSADKTQKEKQRNGDEELPKPVGTDITNTDKDNNKHKVGVSKNQWAFRWSSMSRKMRRRAGDAMIALGFGASSVSSLSANLSQLKQVEASLKAMEVYLQKSGIDLELSQAFSSHLLDNIILLSRIQAHLLQGRDPRDLVLLSTKHQTALPSHQDALRAAKCAVAAYGDSVIQAARMDVLGETDTRMFGAADELSRSRVSEHIGIPASDIILLDVAYNACGTKLRHFVAVDHQNQQVVLAIRGTFNLSELVVDVVAFSRPFCGGQAHSEMAAMAEAIWKTCGPAIVQLLRDNDSYKLVIVGHSLGAGTAALLNIMCQKDNRALVEQRQVECITFASPPVFEPLEAIPDAVQHCTNYIYCADAVSFLSVDAVRHTLGALSIIAETTMKMSWLSRVRLSLGYTNPSHKLVQEVEAASRQRLDPKPGAPVLFVPAARNVWIRRETSSEGRYNAKDCDSKRLAALGIQIDMNMLFDHFPQRYEHALHLLCDSDEEPKQPEHSPS